MPPTIGAARQGHGEIEDAGRGSPCDCAGGRASHAGIGQDRRQNRGAGCPVAGFGPIGHFQI
jgi:hypothetical protein